MKVLTLTTILILALTQLTWAQKSDELVRVSKSGVTNLSVDEIISIITDVEHFQLPNLVRQVRISGSDSNFVYWTHVAKRVIFLINMKFFNRMKVRRIDGGATITSEMITNPTEISNLESLSGLENDPNPILDNTLTVRVTTTNGKRSVTVSLASKTSMGGDGRVRSGLRSSLNSYLEALQVN